MDDQLVQSTPQKAVSRVKRVQCSVRNSFEILTWEIKVWAPTCGNRQVPSRSETGSSVSRTGSINSSLRDRIESGANVLHALVRPEVSPWRPMAPLIEFVCHLVRRQFGCPEFVDLLLQRQCKLVSPCDLDCVDRCEVREFWCNFVGHSCVL